MIGLLVGTGFSLWAAWKLSKCSCLGSAEAKKKDARDELQREYLDYRLLADENPYYSGQDRVPSQRKKARQQKPADERQVTQAARKEAQNNRHLLLPQFAGQESTRDQRSRVSAVVETANVLSKNKKERRRLAAVSAVVETANVISKKECRREQAAAAAAAYCETVDSYIRTRHDFDSAEPTALWVAIRHVKQNCPSPPGASCASVLGAAHDAFEVRDGHVRLLRLTPYSGPDRVFGDFRCARRECRGRTWSSAQTYADQWQMCRACETKTYPFAQRPLLRDAAGAAGADGPPHDRARCGMCQLLGHPCNRRTPAE